MADGVVVRKIDERTGLHDYHLGDEATVALFNARGRFVAPVRRAGRRRCSRAREPRRRRGRHSARAELPQHRRRAPQRSRAAATSQRQPGASTRARIAADSNSSQRDRQAASACAQNTRKGRGEGSGWRARAWRGFSCWQPRHAGIRQRTSRSGRGAHRARVDARLQRVTHLFGSGSPNPSRGSRGRRNSVAPRCESTAPMAQHERRPHLIDRPHFAYRQRGPQMQCRVARVAAECRVRCKFCRGMPEFRRRSSVRDTNRSLKVARRNCNQLFLQDNS